MAEQIQPRLLKGFRDFLPADERERQRITGLLGDTFRSFGFEPIDTPILEYTEILLGKGGGETDKQVYRFTDQGGRDVAMRFDLTVPFARFMAQHLSELSIPFKRFHVAKVFRGENTQRGRYREFMQCDFDIVGTDNVSADFEIVLLIVRSLEAIGVRNFRVHVSHRGVFNRLLASLGLAYLSEEILRTVDKIRKIGAAKVRTSLADLAGQEAADAVLEFVTPSPTDVESLASMQKLATDATDEIGRLREVLRLAGSVGIFDSIVLDPSITRGLDYYTGIVFETFLQDLPEIGSVCSGGRYDNLASLYTSETLPGVGASIGLDRLMAALAELEPGRNPGGAADVMVVGSGTNTANRHRVADALRRHGLRVDVYPDDRKPGQQFSAAENKGIPTAVIVAEDVDAESIRVTVRDLAKRSNIEDLDVDGAVARIRQIAGI